MTLISHEIPKQLFPYHNLIGDYPYILGHLMKQDKEYEVFYRDQIKKSPFCIFDTGVFEGYQMSPIELFNLVEEYQPSHYILLDKLHDKNTTLNQAKDYLINHKHSKSKPIGVLQGRTLSELRECFDTYIKLGIKYIAIPFDPLPDSDFGVSRYLVFKELFLSIRQVPFLKIHFLGCKNPSEFLLYSPEMLEEITSVDTSSPIICGWNGIKYGEFGYSKEKPKEKLADSLDIELSFDQIQDIIYNVKKFKTYFQR